MGKIAFYVMSEKRQGTADDDVVQAIVYGSDPGALVFEIGHITKHTVLKREGWRLRKVPEWHAVFHVKWPANRVRIGKSVSSYEEAKEFMLERAREMANVFRDKEPSAPRDAI